MGDISKNEFIGLLNEATNTNIRIKHKYLNYCNLYKNLIKKYYHSLLTEEIDTLESEFSIQSEQVKEYLSNIEKLFSIIEDEYLEITSDFVFKKLINDHKSNLDTFGNLYLEIFSAMRPLEEKEKISDLLNQFQKANSDISISLERIFKIFSSMYKSLLNYKNFTEETELNYQDRFKEETNLIIKKYENEIKSLTSKYANEIKNLKLDQENISKSNNLLKDEIDDSLEKLTNLNEKTQKIEVEFSKIIGTESEKVKNDLNISRIKLMEEIHSITTEANTKLNELNNAHTDFINLVSNAGIYKLTENYDKKAKEEKKDYKLNMWLTVVAISLAIIATIVVITIPIVEHWKANPPVDMDYFTLFARLSISIMFFVLALYTSKQAAKHYECYQENHRTFLQLAALEPFMARMTHDEQKEIRKGLIPSYFNQGADGKFTSKGDEVDLPTNIASLMGKLVDLVGEKKEPKSDENTSVAKPQS